MQKIGEFRKEIIELLDLKIALGTPIYIGESNINHIIAKHPYEYEIYFKHISDIITYPDYVGISPKDNSIQFVKEFVINKDFIRVAVKASNNNHHYIRTLHLLSTNNAQRYIEKGTLKKLDNTQNQCII